MLLRNIDGRTNCVNCDGIGCLTLDKKSILDDETLMCLFFKPMFANIVVTLKYAYSMLGIFPGYIARLRVLFSVDCCIRLLAVCDQTNLQQDCQ